jgi:hypothetical protein
MAIDINIGSKLDTKGFKQAETAIDRLNGSTKHLAKALGLTFGTAAVIRYGKNAAKAFADDQKAANALTLTLNNLGMSFADPQVKQFISTLESQYGVLDDLLRPAYQKLLTATGDYAQAQDLLKTSLDLAAMSGTDVVSVSNDLAKAYAGNTRGLIKYGLGLSKTQIAAMSFEDLLKQIAIVSKGQAESAANSYSGSLDRLNVAVQNASESIGKDLFTALETVSGNGGGIPKTINVIESLSSAVGDAIIGFSRLIRNISILASGNPIQSIKDLQKATQSDRIADMKARANYGGIYAEIYKAQAKSNAAQKTALGTAKVLTKQTAAQLAAAKLKAAIDKGNLALGKGGSAFDMEAIQLEAAKINQVDQLKKATSAFQLLAISNDLARLQVLRDMKDLEDAIASGDVKRIEAATAKLNADIKILGVLTQQEVKIIDIKNLLASLAAKDLISLSNLNDAKKILDSLNIPSGGKITVEISATAEAALAALAAATAAAKLASGTTKKVYTSAEINDIIRRLTKGELITVSEGAAIGVSDPKSLKPDPITTTTALNSPPTPTPVTSTFGDPALLASIIAAISIAATAAAENAAAIKAGNSQPVSVTNNFNGVIGDPNALASLITSIVQNAIDRGTIKTATFA